MLIEDNTVIARDTSDVFIKNDFGPINNVRVNHNCFWAIPPPLQQSMSMGRA